HATGSSRGARDCRESHRSLQMQRSRISNSCDHDARGRRQPFPQGVGVYCDQSVDQSMTPWSPNAGGRGPPATITTSPIRLKSKKACASAGLRLMQPCDTLAFPWWETDHGAAWTYSPLSEMWTSL